MIVSVGESSLKPVGQAEGQAGNHLAGGAEATGHSGASSFSSLPSEKPPFFSQGLLNRLDRAGPNYPG